MWAKPGRLGEVRWLRVVAEISRAGRAAPHPAYGPWLEDAPFGLLGARIFNVAASRRCDRRPREVGESGALGACSLVSCVSFVVSGAEGRRFLSGLGRDSSPRRQIRWNVALHVRSLSVSSLIINGGQGGIGFACLAALGSNLWMRRVLLPPCPKFVGELFVHQWRTGRDSNPRYTFMYTRFPGVPVRPLWHLS